MNGVLILVIILVVAIILALVAMGSYNAFVKSRNLIQESWRQVDVELHRRYELIPNLVETVRGYAAHERGTLEEVVRLRQQAEQVSNTDAGTPTQQRADVESALSGAVRNLVVQVEAYPELRSNQNFLELQNQLTETEDRIAAGRRYYNANVRVYNTRVESVPSNLIARLFRFEKASYFELTDPAVRQAPTVAFPEPGPAPTEAAPAPVAPPQLTEGAPPVNPAVPNPYAGQPAPNPAAPGPYGQNPYVAPPQNPNV